MKRFVLVRTAERDVEQRNGFLVQNAGPVIARKVLQEIQAAMKLLGRQRGAGHSRTDLTDLQVNYWPVRSYLIIYRADIRPIQILRVPLGTQDVECHVNGHTNGAARLGGDARSQEFQHRNETPTLRGVNILDRGSQVPFTAKFQALLDFPPMPKLAVDETLHPKRASAAELRVQAIFHGKAKSGICDPAPY